MNIKPILFNTEMVQGILEGRKTVTRKVVKSGEHAVRRGGSFPGAVDGPKYGAELDNHGVVVAPYQPGDILYVRETWARLRRNDGSERFVYKASDTYPFGESGYIAKFRWHPSIYMPQGAARIFLRVTEVRVERLNEITVDGILNEGVGQWIEPPPICINGPSEEQRAKYATLPKEKQEAYIQTLARHTYMGWCDYADKLFLEWAKVWNRTVKPADLKRYCWDANPWVWVDSFELVSKEEADLRREA